MTWLCRQDRQALSVVSRSELAAFFGAEPYRIAGSFRSHSFVFSDVSRPGYPQPFSEAHFRRKSYHRALALHILLLQLSDSRFGSVLSSTGNSPMSVIRSNLDSATSSIAAGASEIVSAADASTASAIVSLSRERND